MEITLFGTGSVADRCRKVLRSLDIREVEPDKADLWLSVHHTDIFKAAPAGGILNLHNSYLPWGRGAHPCTWAIIDRTPHGATMHWVDQGVDTGPIFLQKALEIHPHDTADSLYKRTSDLEVEVFRESMILLQNGSRTRIPQPPGGSSHFKSEFDRLVRAMTTSDCKVTREA